MKKFIVLLIMAIFLTSCSKTVEFEGTVKGGSPLERIEFIEASGVATLPLVNVGVDPNGKFSGKFDAPKDGMYVMTYAGKENLIFLKKGQKLEISGVAETFPQEYTVTGDAKNNNDFLKAVQKHMIELFEKSDLKTKITQDEKGFLALIKSIDADLMKNIDANAEKFKADKIASEWKKNDVQVLLLSLLPQYEATQKQMSGNPKYASTKAFTDFEASLQKDKEVLLKNHPAYRNYLLSKLWEDFVKYAEPKTKVATPPSTSELLNEYLKKKTDMSQLTKDYLLAFIITQADLQPSAPEATKVKIAKIIEEDIKDAEIKKDLQTIQFAISGLKIGDAVPEGSLILADGKTFKTSEFKGKPTLLMFYASWTPYIKDSTMPILKQVISFYKNDMNFAYINFDDTKKQFDSTSKALFAGMPGTNYYAEGGLTGDFAKKFGIYGFKLQPSFIVVGKDGKIASKLFFNLGDSELITALDKASGLKAPEVAPQVPPEYMLQNDINAGQGNQNPSPPAASTEVPASK